MEQDIKKLQDEVGRMTEAYRGAMLNNVQLTEDLKAARALAEDSPGKDLYEAFKAGYSLGASEAEMEIKRTGCRFFFPTQDEHANNLLKRSFSYWLKYANK